MQKALIQYTIGILLIAIIDPFSFITSVSYFEGLISFILSSSIIALLVSLSLKNLTKIESWLNDSLSFFGAYILAATILWFYWKEEGVRTFLIYISSFLLVAAIVLLFRFIFYQSRNKPKMMNEDVQEESYDEVNEMNVRIESTNGKVILETSQENVLFFESNDNYVQIFYLKDGNVAKLLERISLKKIEEQLGENDTFQRVHKSYIVNVNKIEEIRGKSQAYRLKITHAEIEIPVSRSFDLTDLEA